MFKSPKVIISLLLVVIIILIFGCVSLASQSCIPANVSGGDVISQAWDLLFSNYVDQTKLNSENMTRAAIQGILDTINDPYTAYLTKAEYDKFLESLQGEYVGIGTIITVHDEKAVIIAVFPDSPAEKAGIKAGDTILEVNGESTQGLSLDEVADKMAGPENTSMELVILHQDETDPVTMEITRANVNMPSVYFIMKGDIAYIGIIQFTERTETELAPVITQLKEANAKGIVLDLRGNRGGYLDTVIQVASHFIPEGIIVKVKNSDGTITIHEAIAGEETTDLPMVVLVDNYSASGSEVLAGALQDHGRAVIAGNTTFGKGSVNQLFLLYDGSGIYITIARWLTPNNRLIEGQGITPDIMLEITGVEELQWAIDYLTSQQSA
jgi:carboxyl-terminal processing protease